MAPVLYLEAWVQRPTSVGMNQGHVHVTLRDAARTVRLPLSMYHYGTTGVVAAPTPTLTGCGVVLDLQCWFFYDLDTNRQISGLTARSADPGVAEMVQLVDDYVRHARHVSAEGLQAWADAQVSAVGGEPR